MLVTQNRRGDGRCLACPRGTRVGGDAGLGPRLTEHMGQREADTHWAQVHTHGYGSRCHRYGNTCRAYTHIDTHSARMYVMYTHTIEGCNLSRDWPAKLKKTSAAHPSTRLGLGSNEGAPPALPFMADCRVVPAPTTPQVHLKFKLGPPGNLQALRQQLSSKKSPCIQHKQNPKENKVNLTF